MLGSLVGYMSILSTVIWDISNYTAFRVFGSLNYCFECAKDTK